MAIDYERYMGLEFPDVDLVIDDKYVMLYALGVGMGRDPMDERELKFVYENDLQVVPSIGSVITQGGGGVRDIPVNYGMVVHGEQRLTIHRALPTEGDLVIKSKIVGLFDKGEGKGALVITQSDAHIKATSEPVFTSISTSFARGDGGFLKPGQVSEGEPPKVHPIPERMPDMTCALKTREDQALLYRLCGDRNPLHADPHTAKTAGFPRPILHGLCTYGVCCRAILQTLCDYDATKIRQFDVRFSAPVFPGETIVTEMWRDGNVISFRARLEERDVVVVNNGKCVVSD